MKTHEKEAWQLGYDLAARGMSRPTTGSAWMVIGWLDYQINNMTGISK